ncbi:N-acetyltransferase 16, like [Conger conger]|uniref:N-acetyltransferase 16, like n=1 Tax=Conger conger TaxID=82655 RepID=UPI002A5B05A7|nr:N-acetyltransferase 16, like [Conger conger]XP_061091689.1 N-acetyltransferase 16, like [Conger conger]
MEQRIIGESVGLTFCLARPEDYGAVMDISDNIYGGNDYLPHHYHSWMTEPNRVVILAKREEKLVALVSGLVVDEGHTVVMEGLRVCPSERGKGVARILQRCVDQYIRELYPSVKVKRLSRENDHRPEKLAKFTVLGSRAILSICGKADHFDDFISALKLKIDPEPKLMVLDGKEQLRGLLLDSELSSRLQLPGGAIIIDWQPLQQIENNLEVFWRRNLTWLADSFVSPTFLSIEMSPYPIPYNGGSFRFNIDMFGTSQALARLALVSHLERVRGKVQGVGWIHVSIHKSLWKGMREYCEGMTGELTFTAYREQLFLEYQF